MCRLLRQVALEIVAFLQKKKKEKKQNFIKSKLNFKNQKIKQNNIKYVYQKQSLSGLIKW